MGIEVLIGIAIVATVVSATFSVIALFQPPQPTKIAFSFGDQGGSPRYGAFILDNTVSNELAIPVLYGQLKVAGNVIWQTDPGERVSRIVAICEGPIYNVYDVRANDVQISQINSVTIVPRYGNQVQPGTGFVSSIRALIIATSTVSIANYSDYTAYLGLYNQQADSRLPADLRPDMELHNLAYLALTLQASEKLRGGNPTVTSICQGLLVRIWQGGIWTNEIYYSRNPAACIRDFILNARYGLGIRETDLDDESFGEVYEYCEDLIRASEAFVSDGDTVLLLHLDGAQDATSFPDSSGTPKTVTPTGGVAIETSDFVLGGACALFNGSTGYLTVADHAQFDFGTGDFCIEFRHQFRTLGGFAQILMSRATLDLRIGLDETDTFEIFIMGTKYFEVLYPFEASRWYTVRISRSSGVLRLFIDGVKQTSENPSGSDVPCTENITGTDPIIIGQVGGANFFSGLMDEIRISSVARGTANYQIASGDEPRYRLDYIADSQRPAQDVLNDMLATFMGFLVYSGSKIKLRTEKAEGVVQYFGDGSTSKANGTFDPSNIVRDSFSWNMSTIDDRPNRIRIQWVDPSQNYVRVFTQVEDRIDQDERNTVIVKDVALLGITRQSQASRMAKLYMAQAKYAPIAVSFSARLESVHCEVGDVVCVTHQAARFTRRLFRITSMQEGEDETIRFSCKEYNASLYDDHEATAIVQYSQPTGPNLYAPLDDVTGLTLLEDNFKQKDGVFATNILASWTAVPADQLLRLDHYLIQISEDGGATYRDVAFASPQKTDYRIVLGNVQTGVTFTVRVKTVSDRGAESDGAVRSITIQGKSTPPSDVEDFDVSFAFDHIAMVWSAIDDEDLFGYEIRVGATDSTWETAAIVDTEILGTTFNLFEFTTGTKRYFIKAIDNSGNYSENAATDVLVITSIPNSNVVFSFDVWSRVTTPQHPLFGTVEKATNGVNGNAHRFNGATQLITIPHSAGFVMGTGDFTVECALYWETVTGGASSRGIMTHGLGSADSWKLEWDRAANLLEFNGRVGGSNTLAMSASFTPNAKQWYKFRITRNGTTFRMFIDGVQVGSDDTDADSMPNPNDVLRIGVSNGSGGGALRYWHGRIDEVRISKGIARDSGAAYSVSNTPFEADQYTSLLLHLDETSGPQVKDESGNGLNGEVNIVPDWTTGPVLKLLDSVVYIPQNSFNPTYNRPTLQPRTQKIWLQRQQDALTWAQFQASSFVWGREEYITDEVEYTTDLIDLGSVIGGSYILDLRTFSSSNLGFVSVQIATSDDGITFSAFTPFAAGQYTTRYVKLKFLIQATEATTRVGLVSCILTVDVPDRDQSFLNQAVGAGGSTITLDGFTAVKSIVITTVGSTALIPRITSQASLPTSFDMVLDVPGGGTSAGNVNIYVKGY